MTLLIQRHLRSRGYDENTVSDIDVLKDLPFQNFLVRQKPSLTDQGRKEHQDYTVDDEGRFLAVRKVYTDVGSEEDEDFKVSIDIEFYNSDTVFSDEDGMEGVVVTPPTVGLRKLGLSGNVVDVDAFFEKRRRRAINRMKSSSRRVGLRRYVAPIFRFFRREIAEFIEIGSDSFMEAANEQFDAATSTNNRINRILNEVVEDGTGETIHAKLLNSISQNYE